MVIKLSPGEDNKSARGKKLMLTDNNLIVSYDSNHNINHSCHHAFLESIFTYIKTRYF